MAANVYFHPLEEATPLKGLRKGLRALFDQEDLHTATSSCGFTGIKLHFGEASQPKTISPDWVRTVVNIARENGGTPFLCDTNTLYVGQRSNAANHLKLAHQHGYSVKGTGAPVVILDGLNSRHFKEVEINLKHCATAKLAGDVLSIDDLIVLTHVTGHGGVGLGGCIKNIGMGMASRGGKQKQHSGILPEVKEQTCTGCGACVKWCPVDAITVTEKASIDPDKCIGCGECTVTCAFKAISVRWDESSINLQEKMAEYAYAVTKTINGKSCFLNFMTNITQDCDCVSKPQDAEFISIGILASTDPVALDQATFDLLQETAGKNVIDEWFGIDATVQIEHGNQIGLGSKEYNLITV